VTHTDPAADPPPLRFEHDSDEQVFRLTAEDGTVEIVRDHPTRYLCVEPEAESGQLRPAMRRGRPVYVSHCWEEPEAR
jgi:hypothetical protein